MKKICVLLGVLLVFTSLNIPVFASSDTGERITAVNDKYVIFNEDFQGLKYYQNTLGAYNKDDNISVPTGWADARTLPLIATKEGGDANHKYNDYWNYNDLHIFMPEGSHNAWTRGSIHMQGNAGGIEGNIALSLSTAQHGAAYNGQGAGANQSGYVKYFSNGAATGNFTLEFDILVNKGGKWALGLIPYDNYDAAATNGSYGNPSWPTSNYSNDRTNKWGDSKYLTQRATLSYIIGQMTGDDKIYLPTGVGKAYNTDNFKPLTDDQGSAVTLTNDLVENNYSTPFNHIKIDFDLYSGMHKVTVTDNTKGTEKTYSWKDANPGRFEKGIMGITLQKHSDGADVSGARVLFDNIEVYKKSAYFIDQNFAGYNTATNQVPGGWYRAKYQLAKKGSIVDMALTDPGISSAAGPSGEADDYAFKIDAVNGDPQHNIYMSLFTRPAYGGHPVSIEFDLKSTADTSWQLHQLDQEYIFAMKGYSEDGSSEQDSAYYVSIGGRTFSANNAILGYSGWDTEKNAAANQMILAAQTGIKGNTYRTGDKTGKGLDITYGSASTWAYSGGVNLTDASGSDFYYAESDAEEKWNHYRVTVIPQTDGTTDYEIAIWPSGMTEDEANSEVGVSYGYASSNRNSITKPICGVGFLALSDQATATGSITIDNLKVYEASARYEETEDITYYDEVTEYSNARITGVNVEYADGTTAPLNHNGIISKAAKRLTVMFSEPVAMRAGTEVSKILNKCMTSTVAGTSDVNAWSDEQKQYFNVFDSVEEAIKLRRNYSIAERNISTLPETKTYLAANRNAYYIELGEDMFKENKEYVLTVSPNITFANSAYSMLEEGLELHFGVETGEGFEYNRISVVKAADKSPITTIDEIKAELAANENKLTVLVNGANTLSEDITLKLFAAQYAGGVLADAVQSGDVVINPGFVKDKACTITVNAEILNGDAGVDMLRCFLWKLDKLIPASNKVEIGK